MIFDWYKVINKNDFDAEGLVSKEIEMILDGVGQKTVMITKGTQYSILIDGVFLTIGLGDKNPFTFGGYAVYLDQNLDIWMGIATSEN